MSLKNEIKEKIKIKTFPQQLLVSKLLQYSEKEIENVIVEELENNPFLDVDKNVSESNIEKYFATDVFIKKYKKQGSVSDKKVETFYRDSLLEKLFEQINSLDLSSIQKDIARYIVSSLDDRGFFFVDTDVVINYFFSMRQKKISSDMVDFVLKQVHTLNPPGIATRGIRDFFIFQMQKEDGEVSLLAKKIIENNFIDFSNGNWGKISREYNIQANRVGEVCDFLKKLKPYPLFGLRLFEDTVSTVTPDFFVFRKKNGDFDVKLKFYCSSFLKIENLYKEQMLEEVANKEFVEFAKEKIAKAKSFIAAIEKRREMLLETMRAIVNFQKDYFYYGDISLLKPMTLKDIATVVNIDVSTVCRIANSKYAETSWGIIKVKDLFSSAFLKKDGEEVNAKWIMGRIKEIIDKENKKKPLSDKKIVNILNSEGIIISRRTVAKYREKIGVVESRIRKNLKVL